MYYKKYVPYGSLRLYKLLSVIILLLSTLSVNGQEIKKGGISALIKKAGETYSSAILVFQNNKLITEKYFDTVKSNQKIETMSCTKSIVGLAVACMLADKLIDSLDVPLYNFFPELKQGQKQFLTLRHLINMTSGIQNVPDAGVEIYPSPDFIKLGLAAELSNMPGQKWEYNNKSLNIMAGVIKMVTGKKMDEYIGERLFKPLGIKDFGWAMDRAGNPTTMSGCQLKPADFVKIGLLVINKGFYNGKQVIPAQYIDQLTTPCNQYDGYAMLWWIDYQNTKSVIDDSIINNLTLNNVPKEFIKKFKLLKGEYTSDNDYIKRATEVFGANPFVIINETLGGRNLQIRKKTHSGNITFRADGYLGNYLIVNPQAGIVAIRMITAERTYRPS